ncbi:MAG: hypothetical protein MUD14_06250 [Hydrococcus sp. Prado102]|jgi:hypothetical protein|nr:hypothetical protein [Hydrococcus sp. Prado102]
MAKILPAILGYKYGEEREKTDCDRSNTSIVEQVLPRECNLSDLFYLDFDFIPDAIAKIDAQ